MKTAVMISCFNWYQTRLILIRDILLERGYEVTVLIADFDHIRKTTHEKLFPECTYIHVPTYQRNLSIQRILSHLSFGREVEKSIKTKKPDLIYCILPPNIVGRYCKEYKKAHPETKLILDIIDLWPESMPLKRLNTTALGKIWKKWRNDAIKVADHVFTECDFYRDSP